MISYEATVCCDGQDCPERVAGEPKTTHVDARGSAKRMAANRGWRIMPGLHVCEACAEKQGLHVRPNTQ